jgi:hypothetical protein
VTAEGWVSGAGRSVLFVIAPYAIHGCLFYIFSQVSHIQQECFGVDVDESTRALWYHSHPYDKNELMHRQTSAGSVSLMPRSGPSLAAEKETASAKQCAKATTPREWAVHQVAHSLDYAVASKFWLHISNGLNLQVVHHLFPQVGWGHYRELSLIIHEVCDTFGVKYSVEPTFWAAVASHFKYLTKVNDEPLASVWVQAPAGYALPFTMNFLDQLDDVAGMELVPPHASNTHEARKQA